MLAALYVIIAVWLTVYGLQALALTALYFKHRRDKPQTAVVADTAGWPRVAVQLPIYNERHVVERLIDAAAAMDYPHDRLEIQVLDDSTDETTSLAQVRAAYHREHGVKVQVLHRTERSGFKAGALAYGLRNTQAEYVAIFDADFRPEPDFLRRALPSLLADPSAGMVQTRWAHLNDLYSPLTRAQSIFLDGHFVVEQMARQRSGLLCSFNGSGGIWRRTCIEAAGGWQSDTMTEDMDLSYRAQLLGWRCLYLPEVEAPAELPPQIEAFKRQQARWAQGSMQCLRKLGLPILRSRLTLVQKMMAFAHISNYLAAPLIVALLLTSLPLLWGAQPLPGWLIGLGFVSLGPPLLLTVAQRAIHPDWKRRLIYLPILILLGLGITWSTSKAVWQGLTSWGGTFGRTPKFNLEGRRGTWQVSAYQVQPVRPAHGEAVLALYALLTVAVAWGNGNYGAVPYLMLYALGFGTVALLGLYQRLAVRHPGLRSARAH